MGDMGNLNSSDIFQLLKLGQQRNLDSGGSYSPVLQHIELPCLLIILNCSVLCKVVKN